jgi:para-nitrobenzyl esterase
MKSPLFAVIIGTFFVMTGSGIAQIANAPQTFATVSIASGPLQGTTDRGVEIFKGIPYAAPPVGPLRWRPPQPAPVWQSARDASAYGNDCMQNRFEGDSLPSTQPMSEDCLYLNVWAPATKPVKPAPVMVWIHGGGLTIGSGSSIAFDGAAFARKGVVLVTFNYRLGRFGFFTHPALVAEHPDEPMGNFGTMDQIAALRWVKQNIAAFGGDPNNVTLFGESSGGVSVMKLMTSPVVTGLFTKAIVESGGGREHWAQMDRDTVEKTGPKTGGLKAGQNFAEGQDIKGTGPDVVAALRALPAETVLGDITFLYAESTDASGPMIDGRIITCDADECFRAGREAKIPLLIGTNDDELGAFPAIVASFVSNQIIQGFGDRGAGLDAYYGHGKSRHSDLISDTAFVEPARFIATHHQKNGNPVWLYRFGYVAEAKRDPDEGARHTGEIPYVFGTLDKTDVTPTAADQKMMDTVQDYWIAFAKKGNPNGTASATWPNYSTADRALMIFGNDGAAAGADPTEARLDYIDKSFPADQQ